MILRHVVRHEIEHEPQSTLAQPLAQARKSFIAAWYPIFTRAPGFGWPPELIMPSTSTAESPEVTKNTNTSTVATAAMIAPRGSASNIANSAVDTSADTASAIGAPCMISSVKAVPPKTENHTKAASEGASTVPRMNSRMVRPRETRAMNKPTKGDQLTHQAQ